MRLLGLESRSTFQSWKRGSVSTIPKDALERISYILGIYKGLHILLDAMKDVDYPVVIVGAGPLERELPGHLQKLK